MKTKTLARILSALGLAAALGATAVFAQAPAGTRVKGYTKTTKTGKVVKVKGYTRAAKTSLPKIAHVGGYTKTTKTGKTVQVKGYTRKVAPRMKMPSHMTPGINPSGKM